MLKQENYQQHISARFNEELESLRNQMLEMGGKVEQQLSAALDAMMKMDSGAAELVVSRDREVNQMEMAIDDECASILARRQPTASDLRLVVAIIKVCHRVILLRSVILAAVWPPCCAMLWMPSPGWM